ncbi:MAG: bi-domain-containing oxidoreductase [Anaerolineales bacterium]|nr:bi-domain-containing oxidoreductase [Anaerolineales bacterium]
MKQIVQDLGKKETRIIEVPIPKPGKGEALVRTGASLVSAGTERMLVEFAEKSLLGKAKARPDLVKQTLDKVRRDGLISTVDAVRNRLDELLPLGYSSAGTIIDVGEGLQGFRVGDRVACAGGGFAVHAEYAVVPRNLMALLPDEVDLEQGAFATLGAIALHGFRLAELQIGERVAVIGLGLIGLMTVQIARSAGCRVLGIEVNRDRVELSRKLGVEAVSVEGAVEKGIAETGGKGFDAVIICAATESSNPVELAGEIARDRARIISVGAVGLKIPRNLYYEKELTFLVSRSYGPGRYDPTYEEGGQDYPIGYVRWTEGRNLSAFVDLLVDGRVDVHSLITHRFPIAKGIEAYDLITARSDDPFVGILLTYPETEDKMPTIDSQYPVRDVQTAPVEVVNLGVIGAGNFAKSTLLPNLRGMDGLELVAIASARGLKSSHAADRYGFGYAATENEQILQDQSINTIAILTRHDLHAALTVAGLSAGKNVFCEKPLALDIDQLEDVKQALNETDKLLMVGFNRRFASLSKALKRFIESTPGPKVMTYRINAGPLPSNHWLYDPVEGGGRIIGEACHFIDFLTYIANALPIKVRTIGVGSDVPDHEDNVIIALDFADGSIGSISYLASGDRSFSKERVEVFGGGKVAVLDDFRSLELVTDGKRSRQRSRLRQDKGHKAEWEAFVKAIQTGGSPPIPYEQLIAVTKTSIAAVKSLRTQQSVDIKTLAQN